MHWARVELLGFACLIVAGVALGLLLPTNPELRGGYARVSNVLGYTYFLAWTVSFYPQLLENYQRGTSIGLSLDFELLNLLGFVCYTIFTYMFKFDTAVQAEYASRNKGHTNKVEIQDLAFAAHAAGITLVTIAQMLWLDGLRQRLTPLWGGFSLVLVALAVGHYAAVVSGAAGLQLIDWLYFVSYIKLAISTVKGLPQVWLNFRRKSTEGWNIHNILCDFMGGSLSVLQLLLDCRNTDDWSGIAGDPVKFGLGFVSMLFDVVFIVQHFCLYRDENKKLSAYRLLDVATEQKEDGVSETREISV